MFVPKISITEIPLDSSSLKISDITGVSPTDADGYGLASYLPQNNTIWTKSTEIQYLGTDPVDLAFSPTSDNTEVAATLSYAMKDGVYLVTQYWAKAAEATLLGTYASGVITRSGGSVWTGDTGILEGVYAIGATNDIDAAAILSSVTDTTANVTVDPGTLSDAFIFYRVQKYVLITNGGVTVLHGKIGDMALSSLASGSCSREVTDKLFDQVLLSSSAKINFNCGNYAKAHNAAILLSELNSNDNSTTCSGCV